MGFVTGLIVVLLGIIIVQNASHYDTKPFTFKERPALVGPLALNNKFDNARLLFKNVLHGPESIVYANDAVYVTDSTGIVKIFNDEIVKKVPICRRFFVNDNPGNNYYLADKVCGRPLGMRHYKDESFIFADSTLGIILVDMDSEKFEILLPASRVVDGKRINFADDFDFVDEDVIVFSDATTWDLARFANSLIELNGDGRLVHFDCKSK